jgi:hypothetical protein
MEPHSNSHRHSYSDTTALDMNTHRQERPAPYPGGSLQRLACVVLQRLGLGERETERQRDSDTERQRDRETERQRERETERQRDQETERPRDRHTATATATDTATATATATAKNTHKQERPGSYPDGSLQRVACAALRRSGLGERESQRRPRVPTGPVASPLRPASRMRSSMGRAGREVETRRSVRNCRVWGMGNGECSTLNVEC